MYDLIILGSGPAGLSAAVYARRANLSCLVLEKNYVSGGQILMTDTVDNYLGLPGTNGFDLGQLFEQHAKKAGAEFVEDAIQTVEASEENGRFYRVIGEKATYETRTVVVATGARHRPLGAVGEERLIGSGVSYCATCDGAFFKNKDVLVVGGGDVAVEDAIYLARLCRHVYLVHRRDSLRAAKNLQETLFSLDNVEVIWDSTVTEILGDAQVESAVVQNKSGVSLGLPVSGVFIAVGILPVNETILDLVKTDEQGYVLAGEDCVTNAPGIFAAGDIRTKGLRQVITAAADGANAVASAEKYLMQHFGHTASAKKQL